ncbi:MAG: GTP-binding protein [Methanimicrococcus sp.]|nr:GTP-binding protein [Methanimicrococcus sp.]
MKIFIIGGFLGSGKTTTILKLVRKLAAENKKVALVVNEIGEVGIDGETLEISGIPTKEITSGCICCSLKLGLRLTISELADIYNPDIIIVEPSGLSFPSQIRDELLCLNIMMTFAPIVTLIDVDRFSAEVAQIPRFVEQQLKEAEVIGINKTDLANSDKVEKMVSFLKEMNPEAMILKMSVLKSDASVNQIYDILMKDGKTIEELIDDSFENKKEVLNSVEISNVSAYSGSYSVSGNLNAESAGELLENMIVSIGMDIEKVNTYFVGHIKMAVKVGETLIKVSQTAANDTRKINAEYFTQERIENDGKYELRFLAAVTNVPKKELQGIVDRSIEVFLSAKGLNFEKQKQESEKIAPITL